MKAMLLAAGEGQRLRPLTIQMPKPMVPIAGKPILEYNVQLLAQYGFTEIVINVHHCAKVVSDYFKDGSAWGVSIRYSYEETLLGTAGAVKRMEHFFDEPFLVMYGDNLTTCNLDKLKKKHVHTNALATIALFFREDVSASGAACLDESDRITEFIEKTQIKPPPSHWVSAGLMMLQPQVLKYITDTPPIDFGFHVLPFLVHEGFHIQGYRMNENVWWADTRKDYESLCLIADRGELRL